MQNQLEDVCSIHTRRLFEGQSVLARKLREAVKLTYDEEERQYNDDHPPNCYIDNNGKLTKRLHKY